MPSSTDTRSRVRDLRTARPTYRSSAKRTHARRVEPKKNLSASSPRSRLGVLLVAVLLVFAALTVRIVDLQVISGPGLAHKGYLQRVHSVPLTAERGSIFDRNGNDLAMSVARQSVWADPRVVKDPASYAAKLAPILKVDEQFLRTQLDQKSKAFVYLARQVEDHPAKKITALKLGGVGLLPESKRYYPVGGLAAPLIGFVGTDNNGLGGLEYAYDKSLTGKPGRLIAERDPQGREIPSSVRSIQKSVRGEDLILTLDAGIQYQAEQMLLQGVVAAGAKGGTLMLADVKTGEVLAMASVDGATDGKPAQLAKASESNRPVTAVFEPGSTNKVITIAGAVQEGLIGSNTAFQVPDSIEVGGQAFDDNDTHPVEPWTTTDIVKNSSNVGTIMIGQRLGKQRLNKYLNSFGLGKKTSLNFPGEAPGILLPPSKYSDTSMATVPTGNGLAVTAAQMLEVFMTVANGGQTAPLSLVKETVTGDGQSHAPKVPPSHRVVSTKTAQTVTGMLEEVVKGGTGSLAAVPGYQVAGKTGTARKPPYNKPPYKYVSSFAGFAPASNPRLAAIVVLDEPSTDIYGGAVAAPVFARVMQYALRTQGIAPDQAAAGSLPAPSTTTSTAPTTTNPQYVAANLNTNKPSG